jgi:hypothetical protein
MRASRYGYLVLLGWLLCLSPAWAQSTYPIQVNAHLLPPYSLYLSDYYSSSRDKLTVTLVNRDQRTPSVQVRLRLSITAAGGTRLQTNESAIFQPVLVETGSPVRLTQEDLAQYFQPNNLVTSGFLTAGRLPEGMVEFCIQAVEAYTGRALSASTCTRAWITSQKPPLLSLPANNESVAFRDPLNVMFQWTPLHQGLALVEYDFILKELWDNGMTPQAAFAYSPEIYRETTRSTSLIYGAFQPPLLAGKRYAWCVRAKAREGMDELNVFQNDGYSEIRWFGVQDDCLPPEYVEATPERTRVSFRWETRPAHIGFTISYREKSADGKTQKAWKEENTLEPLATVYGLKSGTMYEYRVGSMCMAGQPVYTPIMQVYVPIADSARLAQCGIMPDLNLQNQEPIKELKTSEVFRAGDFPVTIVTISGANGTFTGQGFTVIPWLNDAKVAVEFRNIGINTDRQMIRGIVEAKYDKKEGQIGNLDELLEGGMNQGKVVTGITRTDTSFNFVIPDESSFGLDKDGELVIVDADKKSHVIPTVDPGETPKDNEGDKVLVFPMTVKDKNGTVYQVEKTTETVDGQEKEVVKATKLGTVGVPLPADAFDTTRIAENLAIVTFHRGNGRYSFDTWQDYYKDIQLIRVKYQKLGSNYYAAWKLLPGGESDEVSATIQIVKSDVIDPKKVIFITRKGTRYDATYADGTYTFKVTSGPAGDVQELYALHPKADGKYHTLGKLSIATYARQEREVVLVAVENTHVDYDKIEHTLHSVYDSVGIHWTVQRDAFAYADDGGFMANATGLSTYNDKMRALNAAYRAAKGKDFKPGANYIFFLKATGNVEVGKRELTGFMPRGSQFGYIFTSETADAVEPIAVAHELGHGRWKLYHPFDKNYGAYPAAERTNNLMAYGNGPHIAKWQWDQLADPALVVSIFEGDDRSESQGIQELPMAFLNKDGATFTFITYAGEYITLPKAARKFLFNFGITSLEGTMNEVTGVLQSFELSGKEYKVSFNGGIKYVAGTEVYANPTVANGVEESVIMALPFNKSLQLYKIQAKGLSRYNHAAPSKILSESDFPVIPFSSGFGVVKKDNAPVVKALSAQTSGCQWCYDEVIADMVEGYCDKPEILYVSKIAQLRHSHQEIFESGFTSAGSDWYNPSDEVVSVEGASVPTGYWGKTLSQSSGSLLAMYDDRGTRYLYFKTMLEHLKNYLVKESKDVKSFFANIPATADGKTVASKLKLLSDYDILQMDIPTKVKVMSIMVKGYIPEHEENQIIRIIKNVSEDQQDDLVVAMDEASLFWKLEADMNNVFGEANYTTYADLMFKYSAKVSVANEVDAERTFNYVARDNSHTTYVAEIREQDILIIYHTVLPRFNVPGFGNYIDGVFPDMDKSSLNGSIKLKANELIHLNLSDDFSMEGVPLIKKSDYPNGVTLTALQFALLLNKRINSATTKFSTVSVLIPMIPLAIGELGAAAGWRFVLAIADAQVIMHQLFMQTDHYNKLYANYPKAQSYLRAWQMLNNYYGVARITQTAGTLIYNRVKIVQAEAAILKEESSVPATVKDDIQVNRVGGSTAVVDGGLIASLRGSLKSTYDEMIKAGLTAEVKANSILMKNAAGETAAIINNGKLTPTKWWAAYQRTDAVKVQTSEGYIILKEGDEVRFDLGFKEGRLLEAKEANDYLVNGQGKDLDGQPYWAGTQVDEMVLGRKGETIYFVEDYKGGKPNPGQYGSKDPTTTVKELRQKLAVKEAWKRTDNDPTLRAYRVKAELRVRSGTIGRQSDNGAELPGGGHQYEVIDYLGGDWRKYLEPIGSEEGVKLIKEVHVPGDVDGGQSGVTPLPDLNSPLVFSQKAKSNLSKLGVSTNEADYVVASGSKGGGHILKGVSVEAKEAAHADEVFQLTGQKCIFPKNNLQAIEGFLEDGTPFSMKQLDKDFGSFQVRINEMSSKIKDDLNFQWTGTEGYLKIPFKGFKKKDGTIQLVTQAYVEQQWEAAIGKGGLTIKNDGTVKHITVFMYDGATFELVLSKIK